MALIKDSESPWGSINEQDYTITGRGGNGRHRGNFSPDNPYLEQLAVANKNQDIDALYERAVNWEADNAKLLEQRAYDKQVLAEQRAYDDPVNQIARQRAAGINPDLPGGSSGGSSVSGGSSAQLTPREQTTSQAQSQFANTYATTDRVLNGINTASSLVSGLVGAYGTIANSVMQFSMLPIQQNIGKAQARLANANANELEQTLAGKKQNLGAQARLANANAQHLETMLPGAQKAQSLQNISSSIGLATELLPLFKKGFTPDEATTLYDTFGIPTEQREHLSKTIKGIQDHPEYLAQWHKSQEEARRAEISNDLATEDFIRSSIGLQQQLDLANLQFKVADTILMKSVSEALLADPNYVNNTVESELNGAESSALQTGLDLTNLKRDIESWGKIWDHHYAMVKNGDEMLGHMRKKFEKDGRWTHQELALYHKARAHQMALMQTLSSEYHTMQSNFISIIETRYNQMLLDPNGNLKSKDVIGAISNFSGQVFDKIYQNLPSGSEIVRGWVDTAGQVLFNIGVAALSRGKLKALPKVP